MGPIDATLTCLRKPFTWQGRATRSEYWWFMLMLFLAWFVIMLILMSPLFGIILAAAEAERQGVPYDGEAAVLGWAQGAFTGPKMIAFGVFYAWTFFAQLAALVRRLHDMGNSGWWYWISLVPFVGVFILLFLLCMPSEERRNAYGPAPGGARRTGFVSGVSEQSAIPEVPKSPMDALRTPEDFRALRHARMQQ